MISPKDSFGICFQWVVNFVHSWFAWRMFTRSSPSEQEVITEISNHPYPSVKLYIVSVIQSDSYFFNLHDIAKQLPIRIFFPGDSGRNQLVQLEKWFWLGWIPRSLHWLLPMKIHGQYSFEVTCWMHRWFDLKDAFKVIQIIDFFLYECF